MEIIKHKIDNFLLIKVSLNGDYKIAKLPVVPKTWIQKPALKNKFQK